MHLWNPFVIAQLRRAKNKRGYKMKRLSYEKLISVVLGAGMLSGCTGHRQEVRYVVTGRENNSVRFAELDAPKIERIMTFDSNMNFYYQNIRPGDTICCARRFPDNQTTVRADDKNIRKIRTLDFYQEYLRQQAARRDSVICKTK